MTPSLRLRLLEALEPFVREAFRYEPPEGDDDREAFETNLHIGQVRDLARLHDELKSSDPDTERRTRQLANEKEDRLHVGFGTSTVSQGATSVSNLDELKGGDASVNARSHMAGLASAHATPPPSASEPAGAMEERIEHVRQLNLRRIEARHYVNNLAVMNTPLGADKRLASDALYALDALACDALAEAEVAYSAALRLLSPDEKAALASGVLGGEHRSTK